MFDQNTEQELTPEEALAALVGEGKKYATPAELAKAALHANNHIAILESELADLRKSGGSQAEILAALKAIQDAKQTAQAPAQDQGKDKPDVDIDKLLEEKLNARYGQQTAKENQAKVVGHFKEQYGERAGSQFAKLAKELDMDAKTLEAMSAERPAAVIKLASQLLGANDQRGEGSLQGDRTVGGGVRQPGTVASTKSEILKQAEAEKWPRQKKYEVLNREASKATREGRLDAWNR